MGRSEIIDYILDKTNLYDRSTLEVMTLDELRSIQETYIRCQKTY